MSDEEYKTLSTNVHRELFDRITQYCNENKVNRSRLVSCLVLAFLDSQQKVERSKNFYEQILERGYRPE